MKWSGRRSRREVARGAALKMALFGFALVCSLLAQQLGEDQGPDPRERARCAAARSAEACLELPFCRTSESDLDRCQHADE